MWHETLLANQNKGPTWNTAGGNAGGPPGAQNASAGGAGLGQSGEAVLGEDGNDLGQDTTAFGYPVHNGNGTNDY